MYHIARKCFNENLNLFTPARSKPEQFNLYTGLLNLTNAIEADFSDIKRRLTQIDEELRRINP